MKKVWLGLFVVVVAYACSDTIGGALQDAGSMLQDGGAQAMDAGEQTQDAGDPVQDGGVQAQIFPVDCSKGGFVRTNVSQGPPGTVTVHQTFPDPWGITDPPLNVELQEDAWWSIDGKVVVYCERGAISASIEVR